MLFWSFWFGRRLNSFHRWLNNRFFGLLLGRAFSLFYNGFSFSWRSCTRSSNLVFDSFFYLNFFLFFRKVALVIIIFILWWRFFFFPLPIFSWLFLFLFSWFFFLSRLNSCETAFLGSLDLFIRYLSASWSCHLQYDLRGGIFFFLFQSGGLFWHV